MDLVELLGGSHLQQDLYSESGTVFGKDGQLEVVGWSGRNRSGAKYYILKCNKCSLDSELFGEGYFRCVKSHLLTGRVSCGCAANYIRTSEQQTTLCKRVAEGLSYKFMGFVGSFTGYQTKIRMLCNLHGEWQTGSVSNLVNHGRGCPRCKADVLREASIKPDDVMIASFHESKAFHPNTHFWRSVRLTSQGFATYWHVSCPECGEDGEATGINLQQGKRPCACSKHRQTEACINWIIDGHNNAVGIKFGVANNSKQRIKSQDSQSVYEIRQQTVYTFPSVASCKKAERECLQELDCGVVLKRDMKDGYTETTWVYNLDKIVEIYKRNGGIKK